VNPKDDVGVKGLKKEINSSQDERWKDRGRTILSFAGPAKIAIEARGTIKGGFNWVSFKIITGLGQDGKINEQNGRERANINKPANGPHEVKGLKRKRWEK